MRLGVDVSEYQRGFDYSGFDFAIIRTTDGTYRDPCFEHLLADATAAGCDIATYHFLRAPSEGTTVQQQVEVACAGVVDKHLPMWIDVESPAGLSLDDVRVASSSFQQAGVEVAGVYTNAWYWRRHMGLASPAQFGALWLAQWGNNTVTSPEQLGPWPRPLGFPEPEIWQFTSRGRVGGIEVDLNLAR